ncbi:Detected protein of unknown function [Hibiscus syriacus]|uniref:Uncharacterized protein n=1 Tax=Hibiscus syriacus TaxID=106335 RepID=A0A6A3AX96_HIBSY|nr:Detected protein of unknown function [Hibiscus syriacus]
MSSSHYMVDPKVMIGVLISHANVIFLALNLFVLSSMLSGNLISIWPFTVEEVLPGLNTVFSVIIPDSSKKKSYNKYAGCFILTVMVIAPNGKRTLDQFSAGFSLDCALLVDSLTLSDDFDSLKSLVYHPLNPPTRTGIAAELKHRMTEEATTLTLGTQHALFPFTLEKARMNTDGKVSGVLRLEIWQKLYVSVSGELDLRDRNIIPRIGLSMAVKH